MLSAARQTFSSIWKRKNPFQKHRIAFLQELSKEAYLPFGAGARVCIGDDLALLEGQRGIAVVAQPVRFDLPAGAPEVVMDPRITLRPRGGVPMRVSRRVAAS